MFYYKNKLDVDILFCLPILIEHMREKSYERI